jgi:hypothetical protein
MRNIIYLLLVLIASMGRVQAQNFFTKNGQVSFFSKSPLENISATNNQVLSVLNTASGDIKFSVMIKGFQFRKALMQEHFNENYMESGQFPKASFGGTVAGIEKIDLSKDAEYPVSVSGDLQIHGVTKKVTVPGTISVKAGKPYARAVFNVLLADYNISIPKLVENNIAKTIELKVDCSYDPKL